MDHEVDVVVIGAGMSGIGAGFRLQQQCPQLDFAVLEGRGDIGGTWDLFRYPGIRSDSDIATFAYRFRPWPGEEVLAEGASIKNYLTDSVEEFGLRRRLHLNTRVEHAAWDSTTGRWTLSTRVMGPDGAQRTEQWSAAFVYCCTGYYDYAQGVRPIWEGESDYAGAIVHPQFWPEALDVSGKRVVIVGSGATAVTLVPALTDAGAQVTMLQRSPTWMLSRPGRDAIGAAAHRLLPDQVARRLVRWRSLALQIGFYELCRHRPELAARLLLGRLTRRLGADRVGRDFTPRYHPWEQRLCVMPDGDLVEAVATGAADVVTGTIDRFVSSGVRLRTGEVLPADIVVTATGLDLQAFGGMQVQVDGHDVDLGERTAYRGLMVSGVPNLALAIGYTNNAWTLRADIASRYVCRLLNHLRSHDLAYGVPLTPAGGDRRPLIDLTSTYVTRARDRFPQQGPAAPWRVRQNYLLDLWDLRRADLTQDMRFVPRAGLGSAVAESDGQVSVGDEARTGG